MRYTHSFVSFMLFLEAVRARRLQKQIESGWPQIAIPPTEINTMNGMFWEIGPQGKYIKYLGKGKVPCYEKRDYDGLPHMRRHSG